MDSQLLSRIESARCSLMAKDRIRVLDAEGNILLPAGETGRVSIPEYFTLSDVQDRPYFGENNTFLKVDVTPPIVLCIDDHGPVETDFLVLLAELIKQFNHEPVTIQNQYEVYKRVLLEELMASEVEALASEHQIEMEQERCVLTFQIVATESQSAKEMLEPILREQKAKDDRFVEMDRHTVVLLKSMEEIDGFDHDMRDLAERISQDLSIETGKSCIIGIGEPRRTLAEIGESYRESRRAVEVGRIFLPDEHIYLYRSLVLERFLMDTPRETGARYHSILFNRKNARLFNEEMLHTIEMFFAKDLNLSDTARQLYIHRNTLVYRLDKVQRQTGLDLRKFDDAVTFKMMLLLGKSGQDKPRPVY